MNPGEQAGAPRLPVKLTDPVLRLSVEQFVSRQAGRAWRVDAARDMADFACHPAAILSGSGYSVFAKFSDAPDSALQFEVELAGLRLLADRAGVQIPTPLGILPVPGGSVLVLEAVEEIERTPEGWRQIGRALAHIHLVRGAQFGLERHGYFGPLYQDNTPAEDWPAFYAGRRLVPMLRQAVDSGHLPPVYARQVESIMRRLPELCGPPVAPVLIHGDAQQNNFISSPAGAVVIDPAVYYGHPEMDLAYIDYFQPVPDEVFHAYREILPIAPDFPARRGLWRLWGYLAAVSVEGGGYLRLLQEALQSLV